MVRVYYLAGDFAEIIEVEDIEAFDRIVDALEERGLTEAAWDWKEFIAELHAAVIVVTELGGTQFSNAPNGKRYFIDRGGNNV